MSEVSTISPGDTGSCGVWHTARLAWDVSKGSSWVRVVVVNWESSVGVVDSTSSGVVPLVNSGSLTSISKGILEWLIWGAVLVIFPLHVKVSVRALSLATLVNNTVLELSNLMFRVWDDSVSFPDWVVDLGWLLYGVWSNDWSWHWGVSGGIGSLAGGDDGIAQIVLKWNSLTEGRVEGSISGVPVDHGLAIGELDPSGSNTGSASGSSLGERDGVLWQLDELVVLGLSLLKLADLVGEILVTINSLGPSVKVVHIDRADGSDQKGHGIR